MYLNNKWSNETLTQSSCPMTEYGKEKNEKNYQELESSPKVHIHDQWKNTKFNKIIMINEKIENSIKSFKKWSGVEYKKLTQGQPVTRGVKDLWSGFLQMRKAFVIIIII